MLFRSKLAAGLGNASVDFRLRQTDFAADAKVVPWLGMAVADVSALDRVLVVGSTLRKDHPLLANRLRQAAKKDLQVNVINPSDDDLLMRVANKMVSAPSQLAHALAQVVKAAAQLKNAQVPAPVSAIDVSDAAKRIAESLIGGKNAAVLLGNFAQHHPAATQLHALAQALADLTGAKLGFLGEAANSVGGYIAGAAAGMNAAEMIAKPRKAYVLLGAEPEFDCNDGAAAIAAMKSAQFVVAMSPYQHGALDYAHALLPVSPFTETSGTFVNTEGRAQSFRGAVLPLAETRPAWKVLRVLGNGRRSECLVKLLADPESRDAILDDPQLFTALIESRGCLTVSNHFYFYVLVRHTLKRAGIESRDVADYVAELLAEFSQAERGRFTATGEIGRAHV